MEINSLKLNDFEKKIIQDRINGVAVCDTPEKQLSLMSEVSIFKISAICGFTLTANEKFADVLNEEFLLFLKDYGYSNLSFDEIVSAFRLNAKGWYRFPGGDTMPTVLPYSTFFSINYAGQVLACYMRLRQCLDSKLINDLIYGNADVAAKYKKPDNES